MQQKSDFKRFSCATFPERGGRPLSPPGPSCLWGQPCHSGGRGTHRGPAPSPPHLWWCRQWETQWLQVSDLEHKIQNKLACHKKTSIVCISQSNNLVISSPAIQQIIYNQRNLLRLITLTYLCFWSSSHRSRKDLIWHQIHRSLWYDDIRASRPESLD